MLVISVWVEFAIIIAAACSSLLLVGLLSCVFRCQRRPQMPIMHPRPLKVPPLPRLDFADALSKFSGRRADRFTEGYRTSEEPDRSCAICLEDFSPSHKVHILPSCQHVFHVRCIDPWLSVAGSCPTCRNNIALDKHQLHCPLSHAMSPQFASQSTSSSTTSLVSSRPVVHHTERGIAATPSSTYPSTLDISHSEPHVAVNIA
ncbi:hypothetical protein KP509_10G041600 [Ceratopteris richardii]|uniref:RING-type domain-containing protein n=1 Tax=Ceratopteris richardii TaxID=49495 RepID=A0A8T2U0N7_CERRI|nr:hypothetical protein KP509_10G041600 [Ceratopteris richardii]